MKRLTVNKLKAIEEALQCRLAGAIDADISREIYEEALEWVEYKLSKIIPRKVLLK